MKTMLFKIFTSTAISLILTVVYPNETPSYVLQGEHIIKLMAEKLGQADSLFVSQRILFYNVEPRIDSQDDQSVRNDIAAPADPMSGQAVDLEEPAGEPAEPEPIKLEESIRYLFSQAFRSDIMSETNQRIYVYNGGQTVTVIDGMIADFTESRFDLYKDLLLYRSRETLAERLENLGINVAVSSLGKFEDRLALIVGAEFPDETAPQVWIDKETFQPLRMILPAADDNHSGVLEIRYDNWQPISKTWYPMQIEFIQDGLTVRTVEVHNYEINPRFSKDIFNITRLISEYRQSNTAVEHLGNSEDFNEVQKTIEEFKKIFE
jgi:hypothetical protein